MQEQPTNEQPETTEPDQLENVKPQVILSRRKRGVGPVAGMPCEPGYKLVGENCVMANVLFE
ncbi:hypothetical protein ACIP1G_03675 [Pseudomonas sp. NPDC089392]|uniref:hypothetical protein n=1 Tax=Pseudomonas sp. NPDC089392 TaxID=3364459 RepID=UPI00381C7A18